MLRKRPRDKEASASSGVFTSPRGDEIPIKWDNMESVGVLTDMWPLSLALVAVSALVQPALGDQPPLPPLPAGPGFAQLPVPGFLPAVVAWPVAASADAKPARALPVVVATHGSFDQPEWNCEVFQQVVRGSAVIVCPRGRLRWDTPAEPRLMRFYFPSTGGWLGREVEATRKALSDAAQARVADGPIVYAGFSQGAIMGAPLAISAPKRFPRLLLVEGGHDAWTSGSAQVYAKGGGKRVLFACGRASCFSSAQQAAAYLLRAGVAARVVYSADQGHTYDGGVQKEMTAAFGWLVEDDPRFAASAEPAAASP